jgi:hypothetical protein
MKKITLREMPILSEPSFRYHILPDGSMVDVYEVKYNCKVDLENKKYIESYDEGYAESTLPTFNVLYANGTMGKEGTCIEKEYDYFTNKETLSEQDIDDILREFKENGFNITKEAILHNYDAWLCDEKSGYRDEENNYHLFSPCGCNPLSFRARSLHKQCEDWQETYTY